jgi:acyl-CoA reductase-like NAD-dependent aldehyde dehydrogenase
VNQLYIDGKWVDPRSDESFETFNPATGEVLATIAAGGADDADAAVVAARRAFDEGLWGQSSAPRDRASLLLRVAGMIRRDRERLAELETLDNGKPLDDALWDVDEAAYMFEYYAGWATKVMGSIPPVGPDAMSLVIKEPVGVAVLITPWNYPILMASQKITPALAAGCTTILKPPSSWLVSSTRQVRRGECSTSSLGSARTRGLHWWRTPEWTRCRSRDRWRWASSSPARHPTL